MKDQDYIILAGAGVLAFLLLSSSKASAASQISAASKEVTYSPTGSKGFEDKELVTISGANWTTPLYLTLERDVPLGGIVGTIFDYGVDIASGIGSGIANIGGLVGDVLSSTNEIVSGTVIPSVVDFGGDVATFIKEGAYDLFEGAKYVGEGFAWVGGKVVDLGTTAGLAVYEGAKATGEFVWKYAKAGGGYVWDAITGTWDFISENELAKKIAKVGAGVVAGATIKYTAGGKEADSPRNTSDVTTNPQQQVPGDIPTGREPQLIRLGYLSKTPFDNPKSLIVKKMKSNQLKDTLIVTSQKKYNVATELGYKEIGTLGYCSPEAFKGAINMIAMYNANTIDNIVVTNYDVIPKMEKLGYQSLGTIGYCKAMG